MKRLSLFIALLILAFPAQAQQAKSRYNGTLSDFKKVQVLCLTNGSGDYLMAAICAAADSAVRSYAHGTGFEVEPGYMPDRDDAFTIYVSAMSAGDARRAVSVRIEASREYAKAIDTEASGRDPAAYPRKGRLVMFEDSITAYGLGDTLESNVRRNLKGIIESLFLRIRRED
jgi:hypothetical protein